MATLDDQLRHEAEMFQLGVERYQYTNTKLLERGKESNTRHGRALIARLVSEVSKGVVEIQTKSSSNRDVAKKRLADMKPDQVAYLAMTMVVDSLSSRITLLNVARNIGMSIEIQDRLDRWLQRDGALAYKMIEQAQEKTTFTHAMKGLVHKMNADGHTDTAWPQKERIHVGLRLIDQIIIKTGLVGVTKISTSKNKTTTYLEATPATTEWIRAFNETNQTVLPRYAPCLIKPKPWTSVFSGGYYSGELRDMAIVRAH